MTDFIDASPLTPTLPAEIAELLEPFVSGPEDEPDDGGRAARKRARDLEVRYSRMSPEERDADIDDWLESYVEAEDARKGQEVASRDDDADLLDDVGIKSEPAGPQQVARDVILTGNASPEVNDALDELADADDRGAAIAEQLLALMSEARARFPGVASQDDLDRLFATDRTAAYWWERYSARFDDLSANLQQAVHDVGIARRSTFETLAQWEDRAFEAANPKWTDTHKRESLAVLHEAGLTDEGIAALWQGVAEITLTAPMAQPVLLAAARFKSGKALSTQADATQGIVAYLRGLLDDETALHELLSGKPTYLRSHICQQILADAVYGRLKAKGKRK